jgi:hypothetical protein
VNGVYQPGLNASDVQFNDIQRVEVLHGPQGALFGRNAAHVLREDRRSHRDAARGLQLLNLSNQATNLNMPVHLADRRLSRPQARRFRRW